MVSKKENLREHMGQRQAAQQKHKVALENWKHPQHPRQESKRVNYGTSITQGLFYSQWKEFSKSMYSDTERFPRWRKMQTAWSSLRCKINLSLKPSGLTVRKWEPEECQVNLLVFKSSPCQCHPRRPDRVGSLSMSEQAARGGERGCCQCLVSDIVKWEYILIALADRLVMHAWIPDSKTKDRFPEHAIQPHWSSPLAFLSLWLDTLEQGGHWCETLTDGLQGFCSEETPSKIQAQHG